MVLVLIVLQMVGSGFGARVDALPDFCGVGGPDDYGYTWIDSDTAGGPTYSWIDISSVGTEITGLADDNVVGPFNIGFDFPYYWYTVSSFFVGSNGYIAFGDNTLDAWPFAVIPNSGKPNNLIAPLMSDLDFSAAAGNPKAYYWTNAAQDTCIVAYHNVQFWGSSTSLNTFEVILSKPDSTVTFQYLTQQGIPSNGWTTSLSVGIENISGTVGLQYNYDQQPYENMIHDSLAVMFIPPVSTTYQAHDVSVTKIMNDISGGFFVYNNDSVALWAGVKNTGNQVEGAFDVTCHVKNQYSQLVFADTVTVGGLNPGETDSLVFGKWAWAINGPYTILVKSYLGGDQVSVNDSILSQLAIVTYPAELLYDIGYAHTGYAWNGENSGYGAYFVPPRYPARIDTARFYIDSTAGATETVQILDDDGPEGSPGTVLYETDKFVNQAGWYNINLVGQNIQIEDGGFYIGCISSATGDPFFGMDTMFPSGRRSWEYTGSWAPYRDKETQDALIRAVVSLGPGIEESKLIAKDNTHILASPNPFKAITEIAVGPSCKEVFIYDASGRFVQELKAEQGHAYWDGHNSAGKQLNQGIYFAVTDTGELIKLIFVK